jgi:hypothetical protein
VRKGHAVDLRIAVIPPAHALKFARQPNVCPEARVYGGVDKIFLDPESSG